MCCLSENNFVSLAARGNLGVDAVEAHLLSGGSPGEGRITILEEDLPVVNEFYPGLYVRSLWRPPGTLIIGHKHRTAHMCELKTGRLNVFSDGNVVRHKAGDRWAARAGTRKATYVPDDCGEGATLVTYHLTDTADLNELKKELVEVSPAFGRFELEHIQEALK